jgi:hypothetical protein
MWHTWRWRIVCYCCLMLIMHDAYLYMYYINMHTIQYNYKHKQTMVSPYHVLVLYVYDICSVNIHTQVHKIQQGRCTIINLISYLCMHIGLNYPSSILWCKMYLIKIHTVFTCWINSCQTINPSTCNRRVGSKLLYTLWCQVWIGGRCKLKLLHLVIFSWIGFQAQTSISVLCHLAKCLIKMPNYTSYYSI